MIWIVFAVIVAAAAVVAADAAQQRRRRRGAVSVPALVRARIAVAGDGSDPAGPIARALDEADHLAGGEIDDGEEGEASDDGGPGGVWARVRTQVDPAEFRPKLAAGTELKSFHLPWGNDYSMITNGTRTVHFKLEPKDAEIVGLIDGSRTVGEIVVGDLEGSGGLDADRVIGVVESLHEGGFLDPVPLDAGAIVRDRLDPASPGRRKLRKFAKSLSIDWSGADRFVHWWYRWVLRWFFVPTVAAASMVFAAAGLAAFVSVYRSGRFDLGTPAPSESAILLGLAFVLTFAHELCHAAVLKRHDRRVGSAGFMIYFGSPSFFVDASDSLMLDRRHRIAQSFAGPFAELVLAGIASFYVWGNPDGTGAAILYRFALLNYFVIFLNLVPLLELDGYWILSDLIQVPDLRPRSLAFVQGDLWHKLRRRERLSAQEVGLVLYAAIGIAFSITCLVAGAFFWKEVFGGLIVALWRGGLASQVILVLLALVMGGPVIRGLINIGRLLARRGRAIERRIRFKLEKGWRVEAAELIDSLPVFEGFPEEDLSDLAGRVGLRTIRAGQAVFRQGDRPTSFFVVRSGEVAVEEEDPDSGDTNVIRTLHRGDSFGELGLLESAPRAATVRAIGDAELFEVDKGTFDRLLADEIHAEKLRPTLQNLAELRALTPFRQLGTEQLSELMEHGAFVTAAPGEALVEQGDVGDAFYAIVSGKADVFADGELLRSLGPGSHFGEIALLEDIPRTATVVAATPLRAFRLDREGFDKVIAEAFRHGSLRATTRTAQH